MVSEFYWPCMAKTIRKFVYTCPLCQRNKPNTQRPAGLLQPIPIPERPWQALTMDLITDLPRTSDSYDTITVIVDRLMKMAHFVAIEKTYDTLAMAKVFVQHVFRLHGMPEVITSDRDP